jgi:REP element-mobilizing transposase RayT
MAYNPNIHNRRSIRLKGYDYSQAGAYFITLCTQNREHLFGEILSGEMQLNAFGRIAYQEWLKTPEIRSNLELDVFVIMPNHMHGILLLTSPPIRKGVLHTPQPENNMARRVQPQLQSPSETVGAIVRGYKSAVTRQINSIRGNVPVWQRNYYEHIIRDERAYHHISEYILNNPFKWEADMFYIK